MKAYKARGAVPPTWATNPKQVDVVAMPYYLAWWDLQTTRRDAAPLRWDDVRDYQARMHGPDPMFTTIMRRLDFWQLDYWREQREAKQ